MSEQKEKVFVPGSSAKAKDLEFGTVLNLSFDVEELAKFAKANKKLSKKNGKNYLNLSLVPRKKVGEWGDTHSVQLDTWEPKEKTEEAPVSKTYSKKAPAKPEVQEPEEDDVPF